MTNADMIRALRYCGNFADRDGCDEECPYFNDNDCPKRIMCDAADALEAAERLLDQNTKRCEALRKQLRESHESYEKHINELEAQIPKRGEWLGTEYDGYADGYPVYYVWECSECGEEHNGEEDTLPNYCPNCGADMRGDKR